MKIGITLHPYGNKQPSGLGETIYRLSENLCKLTASEIGDKQFVFFAKGKEQVQPIFLQNTQHQFRTVKAKRFWLDVAYRQNPDIDLWIYHNPMLPFFHTPKSSIVIALDYSVLHLGGNSLSSRLTVNMQKYLHQSAFRRASHIVTISDYTTKDTTYWFPSIPANKISTIYAGYRDLQNIVPEPFAVPKNFFLSLGVIKPRKNQLRVVQGFLQAKAKGLEGSLVVAGGGSPKYLAEIKSVLAESEFSDSVSFPGYLTDGQVVYAYNNATALVFPSLIEGFGFPVLEAQSLGVPVITSNTSSLNEVAGEAAIKVNPESIDEICAAFLEMSKVSVQDTYRTRGYQNITNYSWLDTAQLLMQTVDKII